MTRHLSERDAERVGALPLWGEAPLPPDRYRADDADGRGFTDVVRILLRTWPWLKPMVVGTWWERPLPVSTNGAGDSDWSFAYAPVLVTVLALAGPFAGWLPVGINWQYDLLLCGVTAMAISSWIAVGARWQDQTRLLAVAVGILVALALLVNLFAVLAVEGTRDNVAVALVTVAVHCALWLVHFRRVARRVSGASARGVPSRLLLRPLLA